MVYAYALNHADNTFTRVATFFSGFSTGVMALDYEPETKRLWVVCDDTCTGRHAVFAIDTAAGPNQGKFRPLHYYERPAGMPNLNNEGFAVTPRSECVGGTKPVFWSDDSQTGGNALRSGTLSCTPRVAQTVSFTTTAPSGPVVGQTYTAAATGGASGNPVVLSIAAGSAGVCSIAGAVVRFDHPGSCVVRADQAGNDDFAPGSAQQTITVVKALTQTIPSVTATTLRATVTVRTPGAGTPTGSVAFLVDGVLAGTAPLTGGRRDAEPRRPGRRHAAHRRVVPGRHRLQLLRWHDQPPGPVHDRPSGAGRAPRQPRAGTASPSRSCSRASPRARRSPARPRCSSRARARVRP